MSETETSLDSVVSMQSWMNTDRAPSRGASLISRRILEIVQNEPDFDVDYYDPAYDELAS
jgi:hypothetical protein